MARAKINHRALAQILAVEAQPLVKQIASRVEGTITTAVGQVDRRTVEIDRHDNVPTSAEKRFRVALVLKHPSSRGRQAANQAAQAALKIAGT